MRTTNATRTGVGLITAAMAALALLASSWADDKPAEKGNESAALFERLDKNKDGSITKDEVPAEHRSLLERLLSKADANKDGKLDKAEFVAGLKSSRPERPLEKLNGEERPNAPAAKPQPSAGSFFTRLDKNGDGKVTEDEVPEGIKERFGKLLERGDKDGDKALSAEEFKTVFPGAGRPGAPNRRPGQGAGPGGVFRALDTDSDGKLSASEIEAAASSLRKLDKNGDGEISREELGVPVRGVPRNRAVGSVEGRLRFLMRGDKNGDGKLAKEELPERMQRMFDRLDANSDGSIDESELKAGLEKLGQRRPRPDNPRKKKPSE